MKTESMEEGDMVMDFHHILVLTNVLTEPWAQYASVPDHLCEGPYVLLDPKGSVRIFLYFCTNIDYPCRSALCSVPKSRLTGTSSGVLGLYWNSQFMSPIMNLILDPYESMKMVRSVLFMISLLYITSLSMPCLVRP
jgi:hypothetical protein